MRKKREGRREGERKERGRQVGKEKRGGEKSMWCDDLVVVSG